MQCFSIACDVRSGRTFGKSALKRVCFAFFKFSKSVQKLLIFQGNFDVFCLQEESRFPLQYPTLLPLEQAAHQVPAIMGCFLAWVLCSERGWIRTLTCRRAHLNSTTPGEHPEMPGLGSQSEHKVHLTGSSGALTFSTACAAPIP